MLKRILALAAVLISLPCVAGDVYPSPVPVPPPVVGAVSIVAPPGISFVGHEPRRLSDLERIPRRPLAEEQAAGDQLLLLDGYE